MAVISVVTALVLYFAQNNLQSAYDQRLKDEFQSRVAFNLGEREARQAAVSEQCRLLAKSVRIRAALEEDDVEDLYLNARIELRDILAKASQPAAHSSTLPQATFFRFLNAHGKVLFPPGEEPRAWEQQLNGPATGLDSQQIGYVIETDERGADQVAEVVTTPIIESDGTSPGSLVLGFPPVDFAPKKGGEEIETGLFLEGHLYTAESMALAKREISGLSQQIAQGIGPAGEGTGSFILDVGGEPHRLFYKLLNPDARTKPAYRISLYSLKESIAGQRRLRWQILGFAGLVLLAGLGGSHLFSARLSEPMEALAEDSALNRARSEKAEAALVLTEQKYRSIFENAVEGIYLLGADGRYLTANPSLARIYGYESPAELLAVLGNPSHGLYSNPAEGRALLDRARSEGFVSSFEAEVFCKDGRKIWISQNIRSVRDESGGLMHFEGTLEDITERRQSAQELSQLNRELEKALAELKATQGQIIQQERLRALGQMAGGIAHDFNNALTPILGFSELLIEVPNVLEDQAKSSEYLQVIRTAARDAASIVARLKEFYRSNETKDVFALVDLQHLARQAVAMTQPKWKDQALAGGINIAIEKRLEAVPAIAGEESALREVLTNLIFNAVDAMPAGGTITVGTRVESGMVHLEVADTGMGMSEQVRERCLEPFFSTKGERGTGLGLSMVFGIVKRHGGSIEIESESGVGTKFILAFPPSNNAEATAVASAEQHPPERPLDILLVDDEDQIRFVISALLESDSHRVDTANDGVHGLRKFKNGSFDLVITDRAMPSMNGEQLAVAIKEISPNTPVVLLSGFVTSVESGDIPGVDVIAGKPIRFDELREAINRAVKRA